MNTEEHLKVRIKSITFEAEDIISLDLRPTESSRLPSFTAGAHTNVSLPSGIERSYSIASSPAEDHRYLIGVQLDRSSRGGSRFIHESVRVGTELAISAPHNNFELNEQAEHSILIGGGIGITPIWCMAQRLAALGRPFELVFAARSRRRAAFLDEIARLMEGPTRELLLYFDDEHDGTPLDIGSIVQRSSGNQHLYCCGPAPMLAAFEAATAALPAERVHVEYFSNQQLPSTAGQYEIVLAKTGHSFTVSAGETILDTLIKNGIDVPYSCQEGVCGTCEVGIIDGTPDHRDMVLSAKERASNRTMMVCCSGSLSQRLVLDL